MQQPLHRIFCDPKLRAAPSWTLTGNKCLHTINMQLHVTHLSVLHCIYDMIYIYDMMFNRLHNL